MDGLSSKIQSTLTLTNNAEPETDDDVTLRRIKMTTALRKLSGFLQPALTFLNCHFTDYYLKSYWDSLIPIKLRRDLETKSLEEVKKCMVDLTTGDWKSYSEAQESKIWDFSNADNLEQLIVSVGKLKLSEQQLCTTYKEYQTRRDILKGMLPDLFADLEFDTFMSSKKMHEVFKFSEFVACACCDINLSKDLSGNCTVSSKLSKNEGIRHIVDVGSGKGYLSSFLSLYYSLQVLAIDASATNTEGCDKRTAKLDKAWPQLVRRAKERQLTGTCVNHGKHYWRKLNKNSDGTGLTREEYTSQLRAKFHPGEGNLKSITELITTKTDLHAFIKSSFGEEYESDNRQLKCGIIGLHTCGNLGANILKLFVHNEKAHFICVAPCCYNLVQEDESLFPTNIYYGSKFSNNKVDSSGKTKEKPEPWRDGSIGFPLSNVLTNYLNGKTFVVGRNARMLSAYSLPRMLQSESKLDMPPVLHYRTMLQILFKRHGLLPSEYGTMGSNTNEVSEIRVGRMTKDCFTFKDYVTFALRRTFPDHLDTILNDGSIEEVEAEHSSKETLESFNKYYLLRTMFASAVEDLLLLDRLVYLLEQESIAEASVVQLFDPALSPRSHAIVAFKKANRNYNVHVL